MKRFQPRAALLLRGVMLGSVLLLVLASSSFLYVRMQTAIAERFDRQLLACGSTLARVLRREPILEDLKLEGGGDSVLHTLPRWRLLRDVQERCRLTYVYTFVPQGRDGIIYVVDGSPDGEACTIGQRETIPEGNVEGIQRAWTEGTSFVSGILRYEQWGLLKVSAVPVVDTTGATVALVGADMNITAIRKQVRQGVLLVVAISLLALLFGGWFAYRTELTLVLALVSTRKVLALIASGDASAELPESEGPSEIRAANRKWNEWHRKIVQGKASVRTRFDHRSSGVLEIEVTRPGLAGAFERDGEIIAWCRRDEPALLGTPPAPERWIGGRMDAEVAKLFLAGAWRLDPSTGKWTGLFEGMPFEDAPLRVHRNGGAA